MLAFPYYALIISVWTFKKFCCLSLLSKSEARLLSVVAAGTMGCQGSALVWSAQPSTKFGRVWWTQYTQLVSLASVMFHQASALTGVVLAWCTIVEAVFSGSSQVRHTIIIMNNNYVKFFVRAFFTHTISYCFSSLKLHKECHSVIITFCIVWL
jgi:hypothetical protein